MTSLNTSCGFNIEVTPDLGIAHLLLNQVKYGQTMKDGTEETKVIDNYVAKSSNEAMTTVEGDSNGDELVSRPNP